MRALRRLIPRFSLRTLVIFLLLATSGMGLWSACRRDPWVEDVALWGDEVPVFSGEFLQSGLRVATVSQNGTARTWDGTTGELLESTSGRPIPIPRKMLASVHAPFRAASCSNGALELRAPGNGEVIRVLRGHTRPVYLAEFMPDEALLVTASRDETARVWSVPGGECLSVLEGHEWGFILSACFSHDGKRVATGSSDGTVAVWDVMTGRRLVLLETEHAWPEPRPTIHMRNDLGWHIDADPDLIVNVDLVAATIAHPESEGDLAFLFGTLPPVYSVAFSPDGQRLVAVGAQGRASIYRRRRPEWWWGVFWLWELWLTAAFAALFVWSIVRDRRSLRGAPLSAAPPGTP